uniref:ATP synthase F0 subunit 8 n=1 Tax=Millepora sp. EK-2011 TaxID=1104536 RepID=G9ISP2_9CNID|nr:ATP synthase F0 subunit 8 [Millepora sp. EK-2011]
MSQLDTSIFFSNLIEVLICCYILVFYVYVILNLQYYNKNLRKVSKEDLQKEKEKESNVVLIIKRIINI